VVLLGSEEQDVYILDPYLLHKGLDPLAKEDADVGGEDGGEK
jgi:hypothetical protein